MHVLKPKYNCESVFALFTLSLLFCGRRAEVPRTRGSDADVTRQQILDASEYLFMERGYAGTSIRDIAQRVGVTKGSLYYHFTSKEEILYALVDPLMEKLDKFIKSAAKTTTSPTTFHELVGILQDHGMILRSMWGDPSTTMQLASKYGFSSVARRMHAALAGSEDEIAMLKARAALGTVQGGMTSPDDIDAAITTATPGGVPPPLSEQYVTIIANAAMAALNS